MDDCESGYVHQITTNRPTVASRKRGAHCESGQALAQCRCTFTGREIASIVPHGVQMVSECYGAWHLAGPLPILQDCRKLAGEVANFHESCPSEHR
eukprot:6177086-Pleurochrysis_carterae.AAC.2